MIPYFRKRLIQTHWVAATALFIAAPAHADHIKVFLLGGQSNMVGTGASTSGLPTALQSPQADVLFYYSTSLTTLRPGSGQSFGPEITFGRTIADNFPSDNFCLIKYASSGSDLVNAWDKDTGTVYANFRAKVADGLTALTTAGHTFEVVGMLWTQGERDARIGRTTAQYEADLIELISDIRIRYGANLPFFLNRLSVNQTDIPNINPVRTAQENVSAADPHTYLIDADGMTFHDELHFDAAGQIALGEAFGQTYVNSRVPDSNDPLVDTLIPANGSDTIPVSSNLKITFDESVTLGSGSITIRKIAGDAVVESYDIGTPPTNLSLVASTLTINPTADLDHSTGYYVEIDATAIDDFAGNSFAGISSSSTWAFTTTAPDTTVPTVSTLTPTNGADNISKTTDLVITFSENIDFGNGSIALKKTGGTVIESFDVAIPPSSLTLSGSTVTINPTINLEATTGYYLEIDATAIDDLAGNSFAGISGDGTWAFTTATDPTGGLIDATGITATASSYNTGGAGFPPIHTIDGSGLDSETGVHSTSAGTSWLTPNTGDISAEWIQWDLGGNYLLDSIQIWNANQNTAFSTKTVDIYVSNIADPGDPEGAGAANWTELSGATVTLPQADNTGGYIGFSLKTAIGTTLPSSAVRYVRFELNSSYASNGAGYTGIAEIQFYEAAVSTNAYTDWIGNYDVGSQTKFNDDVDGDQLSNGLEAFFGTHPGEFNTGLAIVSSTGLTTTFSHPQNASPPDDVTCSYEWSPNLSDWYGSGEGPGGGPTLTFNTSTSGATTTVTATASVSGGTERIFVRAAVTQN